MYGPRLGLECQKAAQQRDKQQRAIGKPKLDNANKLRSIYFIDQEDTESKVTMKTREKLESPMESATSCNVQHLRRGEACGEKPNIRK